MPRTGRPRTYDPARVATPAERQARARFNRRQAVVIGPCMLYQGDALQVVPHLTGWDHVLTDPPYEQEAHTRTSRTRAGLEGRDPYAAIPFAPISEAQRRFVTSLAGGWQLIFCQVEAVGAFQALLGLRYLRTIVWEKPDGMPQMTGDRPAMGYESIICAWAGPGRSRWNAGGKRGVYVHDVRDGHPRLHPTQKPVPLLKDLLRDFTQQGDVILDPFMGSGSLGVACIETGRRYVGIELDPTMFAQACQWIAQVQQQGRLFAAS